MFSIDHCFHTCLPYFGRLICGAVSVVFFERSGWFPRGDKIRGEDKPKSAVIVRFLLVDGNVEKWGEAVERLLFQAAVNR